MKTGPRYAVIAPCRDEARFMRRTLDSVAAQTVRPARFLVVDDGSTDETPTILEEYRERLPFLRVVRRADRGRRSVGPGVVGAFYAGLATIDLDGFDYLCKLDLDLQLPRATSKASLRAWRRTRGWGRPLTSLASSIREPVPSFRRWGVATRCR